MVVGGFLRLLVGVFEVVGGCLRWLLVGVFEMVVGGCLRWLLVGV